MYPGEALWWLLFACWNLVLIHADLRHRRVPNTLIVAGFAGQLLWLLAAWLVLINVVTFVIFGLDKLLSKHPRFRQRVPEKNLLLLAVVGGSVGALLGMLVFRHKTLHRVFRVGVPVILAVQLLLAAAIALYWNFLR